MSINNMEEFMRNFIFLIISFITLAGCTDISPRLSSPLSNTGRIDEMKNNQNGIIAEVGKLKQGLELQNSQLKDVQQGLLNLNAAVSKNENSGVQILQGDGALIMVFSILIIGMLLYYKNKSDNSQKVCNILAKEVAAINDPVLNERILRSAVTNKKGKYVYNILKKHI